MNGTGPVHDEGMGWYVDHSDGCPKCGSADIGMTDSYVIGEFYWEEYRCRSCGYEFIDEFRYSRSYSRYSGERQP